MPNRSFNKSHKNSCHHKRKEYEELSIKQPQILNLRPHGLMRSIFSVSWPFVHRKQELFLFALYSPGKTQTVAGVAQSTDGSPAALSNSSPIPSAAEWWQTMPAKVIQTKQLRPEHKAPLLLGTAVLLLTRILLK